MSAFEELERRGEFGPEGLELLYTLMEQEARRLPILGTVAKDGLDDLVQEFFLDAAGRGLTARAFAAGIQDDETLARYVRKSVKHWLIDRARRTDRGALRRQIEGLLRGEAAFEQVPNGSPGGGRWRLAGTAVYPWSGDPGQLLDAARRVPVRPMAGGRLRRPSLGKHADLVALLKVIFDKACGSLGVSDLADIFADRFPGTLSSHEVSLDTLMEETPGGSTQVAATQLGPETMALAAEQETHDALSALSIYGQLREWERRILPIADDLSAIGAALGRGRSTANTRRQQMREHLLEICGDVPPASLMAELRELCSR
jgi:hypothetical protein